MSDSDLSFTTTSSESEDEKKIDNKGEDLEERKDLHEEKEGKSKESGGIEEKEISSLPAQSKSPVLFRYCIACK